jgi:ribonucleotide monophosphatase NagD (HAD superfamily)
MDGTIVNINHLNFQWNGSKPIKGALDAFNLLQKNKKEVFFYTNSSMQSRQKYLEKLNKFGF